MSKYVRWSLVVALLVILASGVMAVRIVFFESRDIPVPSLTGLPVVEAVGQIERIGLSARVDEVESTLPEGSVISQWPDPGAKMARGKTMILKVSRGGAKLPVPDVRGLEFQEAVKRLSAGGYRVGEVVRVEDPVRPAGYVIAQNPSPPAMLPGTRMVSLLVSRGNGGSQGMVFVPNVVGQKGDFAFKLLTENGLSPDVAPLSGKGDFSSKLVVATTPAPGSRVPVGSKILIRVAANEGTASISTKEAPSAKATPQSQQGPSLKPVQKPQTAPQPAREAESAAPAKTPSTPQQEQEVPQQELPKKVAKIRYQVPPLTKPLELRIELSDKTGTRVLKEGTVNGGEFISIDAPFVGEARVTVFLGGEFVWQDRFL